MTEMFPVAEGGVDGFLTDLRRCNDRQCAAEKAELLDVLRRVHDYIEGLRMGGSNCMYCDAWFFGDDNESHYNDCPREAIVAILRRWEENDATG